MKLVTTGMWAVVVLMAAVTPMVAQQAQPTKIAYVDTRKILEETPGFAQADSTFQKERAAAETEFQKLGAALDSAGRDFERQSAMLSATQRTAKQKALEDQRAQAQKRLQEIRDNLGKRERELMEPLQSKINSVIEGVRAAGGYAIIFDAANSGIVTADRSLDLTAKVIQQLKGP